MRRLLPFVTAVTVLLAAPAVASAGGMATVGLSSMPNGLSAGEPWVVDITVLQHGRTPVEGVVPRVRLSTETGFEDFAAKPTGKPGVYRAEVVFPTAGRWDYSVLDGFNDGLPHTFPPVGIGDGEAATSAPAPTAADDGGVATGWLLGAAGALLLALLLLGAGRLRRRPAAAPA